jgi:LuxR family quorum sensing-dependent transcriptional regulator
MFDQLSRDELVQVIELSHRCVAVESLDDLNDIISSVESITSFDRAVLCAVSDDRPASLEHYVNHSFGEKWGNLYTARSFDRIDPVLNHARLACGPFRWRDVFAGTAEDAGATFYEAARDFGLVDGIAYAFRPRTSSARTILSLAGREDRNTERAMAVVSSVGPHLHEAYDRVRRHERTVPAGGLEVELTPREHEILAWTQDGKTYWEIGQIIGISQRTVKYHFSRIKEKLDVVSASHAVAKAMRMGLLE